MKKENLTPPTTKVEVYPSKDNIHDYLVDVDEKDLQYMSNKKLKDVISSRYLPKNSYPPDLSHSTCDDLNAKSD